ncbi:hypothetical protein NZK32_12720 [Cyanobium sp. FGCU-52]|nr:hypothetical protein [Cyanobium sp. FGCU52]
MTLRSPSILSEPNGPATGSDEVESAEEPPGRRILLSSNGPESGSSGDPDLVASPLGVLAGMAIALLSLAVPLASVLGDRQEPSPVAFPTSLQR